MITDYINASQSQLEKLEHFYVLHQRATLNLTSIKDKEEFYIKHYLDSIYYFNFSTVFFNNLCDIGSGGGFPGVVIAIFYPDKSIYLCESIKKKCDFLSFATRELNLDNITVLNERVENLKGYKFDLFTARGVSKVLDILKKSWNVSHETSSWLLYKGENLKDELVAADRFIKNHRLEVTSVRIENPFYRTYCFIKRNDGVGV